MTAGGGTRTGDQQTTWGVTVGSRWVDVCALEEVWPDTGVCALLDGRQVAIFRVGKGERVHAVDNFDPFSGAFVLACGIVGDAEGEPFVASPMYKERFALASGQCLDDPSVCVPVYPARVRGGRIEVEIDIDMTDQGRTT